MTRLDAVSPDFVDRAPRVLSFSGTIAAEPDAAFHEIAGPAERWALWFPGVAKGGNSSPPPHGVGAGRWVSVRGGGRFEETVVVHDPPDRWAFRVDATTLPIARALVEQWTLRPDPGGTELTWTFAVDPLPMFRLSLPAAPAVMGAIFRRALRNLEDVIARGTSAEQP